MRVLTVIDHPNPASFTHAIAARFQAGAEAAGQSVEVADLNAEGFAPLWSMEDVHHGDGGPLPRDVAQEQARIEHADAVCFVFPLFWYGMPAMMKGWMDRVFSYGWAYDQLDDPKASLLKDRACVFLIPAGGNPDTWEDRGINAAMDAIWRQGTLGYFGFPDPRIEILAGSEGSETRRAGLLTKAYEVGQELAPPRQRDTPNHK